MTENHHTAIAPGAITRSSVNTPLGSLDDAVTKLLAGNVSVPFTGLALGAPTTLTIASGAITRTRVWHLVDTEAAASTDDLTDISGGSEGQLLILQSVNAGRVVTVKHDASKIYLAGAADIDLDSPNKALLLLRTSSIWVHIQIPQAAASASTVHYLKYSDVKSQGTGGGTSAAANWQTRTLNTEDTDTGSLGTLSSNEVTLQSGTYDVRAYATCAAVNAHRLRLYNVTDGTVALLGQNGYSGSGDAVHAHAIVTGRITLASSKALRLDHYTQTSQVNGLGTPHNVSGLSEIYSILEFWKVG